MAFLIGGANSAADTAYSVANSCRFNIGDSAKLGKTFGSDANSRTTFTVSAWVKRSKLGATQDVVSAFRSSDGKQTDAIRFGSNDAFEWYTHRTNGSGTSSIVTNRKFRDISAWYHFCVRVDTTQSTDTNRLRIYINGVQETSFSEATYLAQNGEMPWGIGSGVEHVIGAVGTAEYFGGYVAEVVYLDGQSVAPTEFGEFDSDSPTIWKPKDVSGLTFGNNSYYLDFEDSGDLGDDESGNGNDFTETNIAATDQATDTPTNSFATLNPLDNYYAESTFSEGNCKVAQGASTYAWNLSTIAVTAGKYYAEAKITTDSEHALVGITDQSPVRKLNDILGSDAYDYSIKFANGDLFNNRGTDPANDATTYAAAFAQNDIIGIALDCDNNKLYFSKGGAWSDGSGSWDSTTFDAAVGAVTITAPASTNNGHYFFASGDYGGAVCTWEWNFGGCPAFSISSGNADANGYGNFEYAVPSGFLALNTKNLGSDGG